MSTPTARRQIVNASRRGRRARRDLFEAVGSARYSKPALHGLDDGLDPYLGVAGTFVEAGAGDGYRKSNTYYLERFRSWSGVLIEPIPEMAAACRRDRPRSKVFECALVSPGFDGDTVEMHDADLMSSVVGTVLPGRPSGDQRWDWGPPRRLEIAARTLSSVLDEAGTGRPDLLSLDVEGYEAEALSGLDFERHAPTWMLIEIVGFEDRRRAVEDTFGVEYELIELLSPVDALYRLRA